jgi:hypothetical protein
MQIDFIYSVCLKKIMTPLLDQPESSDPPLSISNFFTPASFTTKTGRHDIAEILLKVALNTINQIKSNHLH